MMSKVINEVTREVRLVSWKPPPDGWVKVNTDGACKEGRIAGCGGLIRGSDGEWLGGFAKFLGACSAYVAELWGVLEGLNLARRLGFRAVELHVDSDVVVQVIHSGVSKSSMGRMLLWKIRRLIELDWEVVVHHSYREANQCADA
ncbi:ribonuclease H protein, partial [Trifolium medium]|nr:ribonuclease H protein [Trifolium medium]